MQVEKRKSDIDGEKLIALSFPYEYIETLKLKNYSKPTIKTYRLHFQRFLDFFPGIELESITQEQIRKYLLSL